MRWFKRKAKIAEQPDLQNNSFAEEHTGSIADVHGHDPFAHQRIEKTKAGVFGFFVVRGRVTLLLLIAIVLLGGLALLNIPREADPEVKIPIAVVTTVYPGASPLDVENLITDELETRIEEIDNIKLVTSASMLGISSITVEFEASANLDQSISDLKDAMSGVPGLPDDATDPIVTEVRIDDTPILTVSLAGDLSDAQLKHIGEEIQAELEGIAGVSEVPLIGATEREFEVVVDQGKLQQLNLPLGAVVNAIAIANGDAPLGNITIDQKNYNIRAVAKINSVEELRRVVVANVNGTLILLSDIAEVSDTFSEKNSLARLSINGKPSVNTISLQIRKKTGGNILEIVDTAKERMQDLQSNGTIPPSVSVEVSNDYSTFIRNDLRILGTSGVQSVVLIFLILFLALSFREAAISLLAIPTTFLITFFVLYSLGYTLNSLVLFSLVLSLGLLVDAFIIMLEGIFHNMRLGYRALDAALLSVAHYRNPLLSGTLTTIAAFVPMLLVSGILGEFLKVLPITISVTLLSSLFVSLAIVPAVAAFVLRKRKIVAKKESILERYLTNHLVAIYDRVINPLLVSRGKKIIFTFACVGLFIASLLPLILGFIPVQLFPNVDVDFSYIDVELPSGTELSATDELVRKVEDYLYSRSDVKSFVTTVGRSSSFGFESSQSSEHLASINLTFVDKEDRELQSYEINNEIRRDLESITEGKITVREISAGPPTGAPIEARILGPDLDVLDRLASDLMEILNNTPGVIDVESDQAVTPADVTFTLNRSALAQSGLTVGDVNGFLRTAIFGVDATEVTISGEDIDVIVKFAKERIDSIEALRNLTIINSSGEAIKLLRVADFSLEPALASVQHRNFERTLTVRANLEPGYVPAAIVPEVESQLNQREIPRNYEVSFGGEVEDIEQSFSELWNAMIVAVILILLILVLQFDSFKKPLIILLTLPLMTIGVVIGMLIFRLPFSFSVFLGLVSLAGIIVNDAIVLIDKTTRNVDEQKMKPREAVISAGRARLQPILLTTVTTIAGVLPLAFADQFWFGLSISVMFGLAFATLLQLFVVPIIYLQLEGKKDLKKVNLENEL